MRLNRTSLLPFALTLLFVSHTPRAEALERICDVAFENCRVPLVDLIRKETVAIDVAFWFMEDTGLATELINRFKAGVAVRVLMDTEANADYPGNKTSLQMLRDAGIPMREKISSGILHWKMMLFAGQNTVEFSGANYSREAFMFGVPYADYVDEVIYFTDKPSIVGSFKTKYDDVWTTTTGYRNYANVTTLLRSYPTYPLDPEMNFPPYHSFRTRSLDLYKAETQRIDAIMYRITDRTHTDTLIATAKRGVPVRLISEPRQYRDDTKLWHSWNVDRLYMAGKQVLIAGQPGIQVRHRKHKGISHEKLTVIVGQHTTIFGSSNWTSASAGSQLEHNLFTTDPTWYAWARDHFERKWNNLASAEESEPFVPLPPDVPVLKVPANGATSVGTSVTLTWYPGPWAHKYDVYLGTDPSALSKILGDRELGPAENTGQRRTWAVSGLLANRTYYWKVISRTMANLSQTSPVWTFSTGAAAPPPPPPGPSTLPSGWVNADVGAVGAAGSASYASGVYTVNGSGADVWGSADELHFAYRPLAGNGSIIARVDSLTNTAPWTKAGVMMRETTAANSRQAFMIVSPGKGLAFQRRTATGGVSASTAGPMATAPYWVRLTRTGSTIQAFVSTTGTSWTLVGTDTIPMAATIQVGLAVSSHVDGSLATATFRGVMVTQ
jgi:phosphatidylserine/phosphatidylglycerophosphate/cardiolipin synthase-like enzyme/regulation of enolase protein 1 (concanavalin A-like superfamily)